VVPCKPSLVCTTQALNNKHVPDRHPVCLRFSFSHFIMIIQNGFHSPIYMLLKAYVSYAGIWLPSWKENVNILLALGEIPFTVQTFPRNYFTSAFKHHDSLSSLAKSTNHSAISLNKPSIVFYSWHSALLRSKFIMRVSGTYSRVLLSKS
jgi:hypothetical protein